MLGAVLLDDSAWPSVVERLVPGDFYRRAHALIFEAMARLIAAGSTPADFVLLKNELAKANDLDEVGGPAYLASLTDGLPHAVNAAHYADVIKEQATLRKTIFACQQLTADAYEASRSSSDLVEAGVRTLLSLAIDDRRTSVTAAQAVGDYIASLDDRDRHVGMKVGFTDFDALTLGVHRGELTIVAARPSVGKTSFALGAALGLARAGQPAAFFSLEMTPRRLAARLVAWGSRYSSAHIEAGELPPDAGARISHAWTALNGVPLRIEEVAPTLTQIAARCQKLQQVGTLSCVIVDYLQLLSPDRRGRSREEDVAMISRGLKQLAKDRGVAVIACSQLSRASEDRKDKRPLLSDLRESGALEQDADTVVLLFRQAMHSQKDEDAGVAEVIVAKQRNGPTGVVRMAFLDHLAQFTNLATRDEVVI